MLQFVLFSLVSLAFADDAKITFTPSQNPPQATIRFEGREIKSFSTEDLTRRQTTIAKILDRNDTVYDNTSESIQILKSSDSPNLVRAGVNNGLAGAMFEAYANHIPLTLRPDDVWLAITAAFGMYVNHHPEQMRKLLVTHEGKQELVVHMAGSLAMSDEAFWTTFTSLMLKEMKKFTPEDLSKWLVPEFSTTTQRDRLVGQIVVMGAMKEFFSFRGVLSSALTELTLKGTLEDWQNLRERAAKLAQYGDDMSKWTELLLPVLDQFVAAYQGKVDEPFWQKMITYKRLGSGGQKKFRGWFLVFAPFNDKGEYFLNSKDEVEKTGIYATVMDSEIQRATVSVPVSLDDNGVEHSLVFWGGVSLPSYDKQANRMSPTVDWAIVDKKPVSKEVLLKTLSSNYWEYKHLPEKYKSMITEEEFAKARKDREQERADQEAKRKAEQKAKHDAVLLLPKAEFMAYLMKMHYWDKYDRLDADFKKLVTEQEFNDAKAVRKVELDRQAAESKAKWEADEKAKTEAMLKLPKDELIKKTAQRFMWSKYEKLPEELKALVTEAEFKAAVEKFRQESDDWQ